MIGLDLPTDENVIDLKRVADGEVYTKNQGSGKTYVGHIYNSNTHGEKVYVSFRKRNLRFRKKNSYPIDKSIGDRLEGRGISRVLIFVDTGIVYEYTLDQYLDCEPFDEDFGKQLGPDIHDAKMTYSRPITETDVSTYPDKIVF